MAESYGFNFDNNGDLSETYTFADEEGRTELAATKTELEGEISALNETLTELKNGTMPYIIATSFEEAYDLCSFYNGLTAFMVFNNGNNISDAPVSSNRWFGFEWKSSAGTYAIQITLAFNNGQLYFRRMAPATEGFIEWEAI